MNIRYDEFGHRRMYSSRGELIGIQSRKKVGEHGFEVFIDILAK